MLLCNHMHFFTVTAVHGSLETVRLGTFPSPAARRDSDLYLKAFVYHPRPSRPRPLYRDFRLQYLVVTGQAYRHRAENIMATWGPIVGTINNDSLAFVSDIVTHAASKQNFSDSSTITTTLSPALPSKNFTSFAVLEILNSWSRSQVYRQSQLKWIRALLLCDTFPEFDWLAFVDDDTFVIHNAMREMLQLHNSNTSLLLAKKNGGLSVCGGAGMILSKRMVQKLTNPTHRLQLIHAFESAVNDVGNNRFYADVVLSKFIRDNNIGKIINIRELKNEGSRVIMGWYRQHTEVNRSGVITYHHVSNSSEYRTLFEHYYGQLNYYAVQNKGHELFR